MSRYDAELARVYEQDIAGGKWIPMRTFLALSIAGMTSAAPALLT